MDLTIILTIVSSDHYFDQVDNVYQGEDLSVRVPRAAFTRLAQVKHWSNAGQTMLKRRSNPGQTPVDAGQIRVKYWSNTGQTRVKHGSSAGQRWAKHGSNTGQIRVKRWSKTGRTRVICGSSAGQTRAEDGSSRGPPRRSAPRASLTRLAQAKLGSNAAGQTPVKHCRPNSGQTLPVKLRSKTAGQTPVKHWPTHDPTVPGQTTVLRPSAHAQPRRPARARFFLLTFDQRSKPVDQWSKPAQRAKF
jgi:hypothetical protein